MSIPFGKSFASHEKSAFWSSKNEKKPSEVFKTSNKKYWLDCDNCDHDFDKVLSNLKNDSWCPYCTNQKLCENIECIECFNKSFSSHEKSKYWRCKNNEYIDRCYS